MKFDFEKFKKVTSSSLGSDGVFVLRSDEEKVTFKKYLDEKQFPYDEMDFVYLWSDEGLYYDDESDMVCSCSLLDYSRYYMEDFILSEKVL